VSSRSWRPTPRRAALSAARLLLALWLTGGAAVADASVVAVAVDEPGGSGSIALVNARRPWRARTGTVPIGRDSVLRARGRRIYALSRAEGRLYVVEPYRGRTLGIVELGDDSLPEDIVVVSRRRAYVSRRDATHLLRVDPSTGATREVVDLSGLADADSVPDMARMIRYRDRLFVQLRRTNAKAPGQFEPPALLAVVNLRTETLVDVDPDRAGVQGIELQGTPPRFGMQVWKPSRRLYVSATGGFFDAGGIEAIDLRALRSLGLVIREADGKSGADTGAFVLTSKNTGYLTFSTDLLLSSHLVRFRPNEGVVSGELHVTLNYFVPVLLHDRRRRQLFLIDGGATIPGAFVFDAISGEKLTPASIPTGGVPTDAVLMNGTVPHAALPAR
jgi:hypothetical protein